MKYRDKEYVLVDPKAVNLEQAKLLMMAADAYDGYVGAKDEDEEKAKKRLEGIWKRLMLSGVCANTDEVIQSINLPPHVFGEVFQSFFPKSSEAPK